MMRVRGIPVGPGVAVGTARVVVARAPTVPRRHIPPALAELEVERLRRSVQASRDAVEALRTRLGEVEGETAAALLDPLVQMHRDPLLVERAAEIVRSSNVNAELAVLRASEDTAKDLESSASAYLRERSDDIRHVGRHILRALQGERRNDAEDEPHVLLADDLSPAELALASRRSLVGIATTTGSGTSHTALLARSIGIPAVVGARYLPLERAEGSTVVVDGLRGEVIVDPTPPIREAAIERSERFEAFAGQLAARRDLPVATTDGVEVDLRANLDFPSDAPAIARQGLAGVGLFRTEYLVLGGVRMPTEDEQTTIYGSVVEALGGLPVVLRTFDLGGDKVRNGTSTLASTNVMGRTGIRRSLFHPEELRAQLRAVLRASVSGPLALLFPRVTRLDELAAARAILDACRADLEEQGIPFGDVPVGIMIEVPAAALLADRFAAHCDFFAIGTNDLTQFTLAVDRSDEVLAEAADALDPAVLELLARAVKAARKAGIRCSICGDVASDPLALPLLLGFGVTSFSVPRDRAPFVAEGIRRSSVTDAKLVAERALELGSAREVRAMCIERFAPRLGDLWVEQGIELPEG